jgi:PPIC-type PPIASE domain
MWGYVRNLVAKLTGLVPNATTMRTLSVAAVTLAGVGAVGFFLGRQGGPSDCQAQSPQPPAEAHLASGSSGDYSQRIVAFIYGNIPVTREELAEFSIARYGVDRVDVLVNHRLVEMACKPKGIYVTDAEVEARIKEELRALGNITARDFENQILRPRNRTLYEFKEDVVRLKLMLAKLVRPTVTVTAEDLQKAFEARYHEKVECRMIVLRKEDRPRWAMIWEQVSKGEAEFDKLARAQFIADLASQAGKVPPIHKHFGDPRIEKEAFRLQDGQISQLLEMPDATCVILKRDRLIPADTTKQIADVRLDLHREITEQKVTMEAQTMLQRLREQARPQVFLRPQSRPDAEHTTQPVLRFGPGG